MPPHASRAEWVSATVAKAGHRPGENEDVAAASPDGLRFAVADGATEGWESGPWAAHLASAYVRRPPGPADFDRWLARVRRDWKPAAPAGPAAWYASEKRDEGSFAALAGLELRRRAGGGWAWKALAVGDSCLVHVRNERVEAAFPLSSPGAFGRQPPLVPSAADLPCPEPEWLAGRAEPGDLFLLATDAAAARLLDPAALGPALAAVGAALEKRDPAPLTDWLREVQTAVNDDATLVAVRLPDAAEAP